jgi:hypothetical protein
MLFSLRSQSLNASSTLLHSVQKMHMLHERLVSVALSKAAVLREWHFAAILTFYAFIRMGLSLSPNVCFFSPTLDFYHSIYIGRGQANAYYGLACQADS